MKQTLIILPILLLLLSGCTVEIANVSYDETPYDEYSIQQGNISLGDSFVGNVEALEQTMVAPKVGGRINQILVEEGDIVKKGDILASLDGEEIGANYSSASNVLNSTQLLYNNTASMFDSQIKAMENKINQSQSAIELAEKSLEGVETGLEDVKKISIQQLETAKKQVEQASLAVETTESELEHTKTILAQKEKDIYSNSKNTLAQSKILIINISDFIDQNLGISDINKYKNDDWEDYLGAKDSGKISITKQEWKDFDKKYEELSTKLVITENSIEEIIANENNKEEMYNILKETENLLIMARKLTANMYSIIDSSIVSSKLPQSKLDTMRITNINYQDNIEKMLISVEGDFIIGIKGALQAINNLNKESNMQLDLLDSKYEIAKKQLETAEQTYKQYVAISQGEVNEVNTKKSISEQQYKISQQQYNEALSQLEALKKQKQSQLSEIQAQLNQIRGNKNLASIQMKNTNITAPYDGVIVEKIGNLGQVVGQGNPIFAIADNKTLKVKIFVAEQIVKDISLGDSVSIKTNVNSEIITGNIYYISPISDIMSKRVPIEIKINNQDLKLRLGMYTTVYLTGKEMTGYKVPYSFIKYKYGESYISIRKNDKIGKEIIEILGCNDGECIIKGNINNGDTIIDN